MTMGNQESYREIRKPHHFRMVIVMQAKRSHRKGCVLFAVHISSDKGKEVEDADFFEQAPSVIVVQGCMS